MKVSRIHAYITETVDKDAKMPEFGIYIAVPRNFTLENRFFEPQKYMAHTQHTVFGTHICNIYLFVSCHADTNTGV